MRSVSKTRLLIRLSAVSSLVVVASFARSADAHFVMNMPAPSNAADNTGGKGAPPCGPDAASAVVTTVTAGSLLPISITETVGHPGHYRFALAATRAGLPADPATTADANGNSTSAAIENPTVLPVIADGIFQHTTQVSGTQWAMSLQLPAGMTCAKCTLQIIEYMNGHGLNVGGGYFYHHCVDLNIVAGTGGGTDAGTDARADGGTDTKTGSGGATGGGQGGATGGGQGGATGGGQGGATTAGQGGATTAGGQGGANSGNAGMTGSSGKGGSSGSQAGSTGSAGVDAGTLNVTKADSGCSFAAASGNGAGATGVLAGALLLFGLVLRRRRR